MKQWTNRKGTIAIAPRQLQKAPKAIASAKRIKRVGRASKTKIILQIHSQELFGSKPTHIQEQEAQPPYKP
jgi:hypothetical protein